MRVKCSESKKLRAKHTEPPTYEHHLLMHHISGKKSPMGSIEVPIDREYPHEETVRVCQIAICF